MRRLRRLRKLSDGVWTDGVETFYLASVAPAGLSASRIIATNAATELVSVTNLASWIAGGIGIEITDDGDGTITVRNGVYTVVNHDSDTILTLTDMRKIHIMDISGGEKTFTLPSVAAANLGDWIILVRLGTANRLLIQAADTDTILDSSAGGTIECSDATYDLSAFSPLLLTATRWGAGPGCFGIWDTK